MLDEKKIREIIKNTDKFYEAHAQEFTNTRKKPWTGWFKCLEIIKQKFPEDKISVLDIASGNGRFYEFLIQNSNYKLDYLGLDNNDFMMIEALLKYQYANFKNFNVFFDLDSLNKKYNVISIFGLTHHIPGNKFRMEWFEKLPDLIGENGLLIMTFWQLGQDQRFKKAVKADDLEENDYYYGWGDSDDKRYVHIYTDEELQKINELFEKKNTVLIETFTADGKNNNLNKYFIFERRQP